ncbi:MULTISPECIES: hypothetical protein, partial [unclassified Pseudomonas]|uniref:hypothetical protein n=1 Tax=unclassified Pseudomonas TaxID=196821 RepID=UPI0021C9C22B
MVDYAVRQLQGVSNRDRYRYALASVDADKMQGMMSTDAGSIVEKRDKSTLFITPADGVHIYARSDSVEPVSGYEGFKIFNNMGVMLSGWNDSLYSLPEDLAYPYVQAGKMSLDTVSQVTRFAAYLLGMQYDYSMRSDLFNSVKNDGVTTTVWKGVGGVVQSAVSPFKALVDGDAYAIGNSSVPFFLGGAAAKASAGRMVSVPINPTVFRVQGGRMTKASRELISINDAGDPVIKKGTININIGGFEHAEYFLGLRPGAKITSFEVPQWMDDFIQREAVGQYGYRTRLCTKS